MFCHFSPIRFSRNINRYSKESGFIMSVYLAAWDFRNDCMPYIVYYNKKQAWAKRYFIIGSSRHTYRNHYILFHKNRISNIARYEIVKSEDKSTNLVKQFLFVMIIGFRSWVSNTFTMYIPTYYVIKGFTEEAAGGTQAGYLLFTSIGGIVGGIITDRIGVKKPS